MKIGILSDVHGNADALAVVLAEFRRRGVSELWFLGDMVGYYPFAAECVAMLRGFDVLSIRGNHDEVALECLSRSQAPGPEYRRRFGSALGRSLAAGGPDLAAFLQGLPLQRRIEREGRSVLMCHGSPWNALEGRVYPDFGDWTRFDSVGVDVVLLGHTHCPVQRQCGPVLVVNPGSVGQARHRSRVACAATLELPSLVVEHLELVYDPARVIADAHEHDPDLPFLVEVLQRNPARASAT